MLFQNSPNSTIFSAAESDIIIEYKSIPNIAGEG